MWLQRRATSREPSPVTSVSAALHVANPEIGRRAIADYNQSIKSDPNFATA